MATAKVGDHVVVESERVGREARRGVILAVLGQDPDVHFRVRWEDGHESSFFPSSGNLRIVAAAGDNPPA